jgi:hypothetical protein
MLSAILGQGTVITSECRALELSGRQESETCKDAGIRSSNMVNLATGSDAQEPQNCHLNFDNLSCCPSLVLIKSCWSMETFFGLEPQNDQECGGHTSNRLLLCSQERLDMNV